MSLFITLEGPDGGGKTTQARLLAAWLCEQGHAIVLTREPGGTPIGDQIRAVLHDPDNTEMDPCTEILLYSASRAQHTAQVIRPALAAGKIVISDRYYDSTLAYQGYGRGLDLDALRRITAFATGGLVPDLTLYVDVGPEEGLRRRLASYQREGGEWNRLDREALAFHTRVRAGFRELAAQEPARWVLINGEREPEQVQEELRAVVAGRLVQQDWQQDRVGC